ncbi:MAG: DUF1820 family protein [Oligoflexales bacterium]
MNKDHEDLYRVRFQSKDDKQPLEVVVKSVGSSEFLGLLSLEGFVFSDQTKQVILPTEDEARKRFSKINRLHIPYHNILFIEEFHQEEPDLKNLPFIKEVENKVQEDLS